MTTLQTTAEEMAETHAGTLGAIPAVLVPIFFDIAVAAIRCWFSGGSKGAMQSERSLLHQEHDKPRTIKRAEKCVRRTFNDFGRELSQDAVRVIAMDLLERGRLANEQDMGVACKRAWS